MISEYTDDELMDILMTSEFKDDYSPDELKFLLFKWRQFYKIKCGIYDRDMTKLNGNIMDLNDKINIKEHRINDLIKDIYDKQNEIYSKDKQIKSIKNRNLSLKERFLGKIILKENENSRL